MGPEGKPLSRKPDRAPRRAAGDDVLEEIATGRVAPAYLVHGPDRVRCEELLTALRRRVLAPGWEALNEARFEGAAVPLAEVLELAAAPPFGGGMRLLVVRESPLFQGPAGAPRGGGAADAARLAAYLERPAPTACLVFVTEGEVAAGHRGAAAVAARGRVVAARPPGPKDLARWLQAEAAARGKRLDAELAAALVARCRADRVLLRNELEKLVAYVGDRAGIGRGDVAAVIGRSREERTFDLVDAVAAGRPGRAAALARDLLAQGEPPLALLALIARQYRLIWRMKSLAGAGVPAAEAAARLGVHPYAAEKALQQGRALTAADLAAALEAVLEADLAIKTGALPPELAVETLCVSLCNA